VKNLKAEVGCNATEPVEVNGTEPVSADVPEFVSVAPGSAMALQRWVPILLKFASVQVIVQVLGFAAGILVIRNLPKREYAFYTLSNTMLSTVLVLADSGIGSALIAIGGRIWQDNYRLAQLIETAVQIRRRLALVAAPIVIPLLIWLLRQNGATVQKTALLVVAVLAGCSLELITRIYAVALRLKSEVRQIQNQSLVSAILKLAIVGIAVMFWFNVEIAILAVVSGYAVQYWMLRRWADGKLDAQAPSDPAMRTEIYSVVKKQAPHTIYYCLQGQITVWLIGIFGNADGLADIGALGRLAVVFSVLGALTSELLFPAFARIQNPHLLRKRYLQIVLTFIAISALLTALVAIFPEQILSVLGNRYSHLHSEGVLMTISSVLGATAALVWGLNTARAWIVSPIKFISFSVAIQIVLVFFLKLSTVRGVLMFSILCVIPGIVWSVCFSFLRINRMQKGV
jgi:O-antigen/teichoic acid export membrane protein